MRKIGSLSTAPAAERFHRYLQQTGIENRVDAEVGRWDLWVYDESQIPSAKEAFAEYQLTPDAKKFDAPAIVAPSRPEPEVVRPRRRQLKEVGNQNVPVTILTAVMCLWMTFATAFGQKTEILSDLLIAMPGSAQLVQVEKGEIWRLLTPIFLHFSPMHLAFNLYMFWMLGTVIERLKGTRTLFLLILTIGIASNLVQFSVSGPSFGGLSGVVYGLFGYLWMRSYLLPDDGLDMPQSMVTQMIFWIILCLVLRNQLPIANGAHFGGLFFGMLLGAFPRLWRR